MIVVALIAGGFGFVSGLLFGVWLLTEILFPSGLWKIFTTTPKGK